MRTASSVWSNAWRSARLSGVLLGLSSALLPACSGDPPAMACGVAGRTRNCPCGGTAVGIQSCQLDGQWEACTCYPRESTGQSGSGGTAGRSQAGASSTAGASSDTGVRAGTSMAGSGGTAGARSGRTRRFGASGRSAAATSGRGDD